MADVEFVVHTPAPAKFRFWKENTVGAWPRPVAVTPGSQGIILVLDYDLEPPLPSLLQCVSRTKKNLKDAQDLCCNEGIIFIRERGSLAVSFVNL